MLQPPSEVTKCKENPLKPPTYPTWAPIQMQRTKCTEELNHFSLWASRFLCSRSIFCKLFSKTISLLSTSLRMESADLSSWWMALLTDSSFGLITELFPSGSSLRAGRGLVSQQSHCSRGHKGWLLRWQSRFVHGDRLIPASCSWISTPLAEAATAPGEN